MVLVELRETGPMGPMDGQPVIDTDMTGDPGVLQCTKALLYHVPKSTKKRVLRAAWRELCPICQPPGTLAIAVGSLLALLVGMTEHGGEGRDFFAIEGFLRVLDAHFCCPSRLVTDDDGDEDDEDRVVNVIQQLRRDAEEGAAWRANESGEFDDADWDDDDPDAADDDNGGDGDADADY